MPTPATPNPRSPREAINSMSPGDRRVLNENELAQRWGISPKTLQRWRSEGRGPKYLKLSKRVQEYVDIEFSVPESRFNNWPAALREQFEPARTVKPGKSSYDLAIDSED